MATMSWAGFVMLRTVLDPGRSEALADTLLDNEEIRAAIVDRLSDAVEAQVPDDVPVTRATIEEGAAIALDDPEVERVIRDGLVRAHQNALAGVDEPVLLDAGALGSAGRAAVVAQEPELDPVLPAAPELEVELPTAGLARLGAVKRFVERFTLLTGIVAASGVALAFLLARNRPAALRRVAYWAFGASAFWLLVAFGIPRLLDGAMGRSASVAAAIIDVFIGAMIPPAVTLAVIGVGLLVVSFIWPAVTRRRPAAKLDRAARRQPDLAHRPDRPPNPARASVAAQPRSRSEYRGPIGDAPTMQAPPRRPPAPAPAADHTMVAPPGLAGTAAAAGAGASWGGPATPAPPPDATTEFPQVYSATRPAPAPAAPAPSPTPPSAHPPQPPRHHPPQPPPQDPASAYRPPAPPTEVYTDGAGFAQIDPARAAADDDFGAEWVEGVGYVDGDSGRS